MEMEGGQKRRREREWKERASERRRDGGTEEMERGNEKTVDEDATAEDRIEWQLTAPTAEDWPTEATLCAA